MDPVMEQRTDWRERSMEWGTERVSEQQLEQQQRTELSLFPSRYNPSDRISPFLPRVPYNPPLSVYSTSSPASLGSVVGAAVRDFPVLPLNSNFSSVAAGALNSFDSSSRSAQFWSSNSSQDSSQSWPGYVDTYGSVPASGSGSVAASVAGPFAGGVAAPILGRLSRYVRPLGQSLRLSGYTCDEMYSQSPAEFSRRNLHNSVCSLQSDGMDDSTGGFTGGCTESRGTDGEAKGANDKRVYREEDDPDLLRFPNRSDIRAQIDPKILRQRQKGRERKARSRQKKRAAMLAALAEKERTKLVD